MPLTERRMRWEAMMSKLRTQTIQQWFADFTDALRESRHDSVDLAPVMTEPALWPLRSATNSNARYH
jgi:trehalose 6-phosphate synthase